MGVGGRVCHVTNSQQRFKKKTAQQNTSNTALLFSPEYFSDVFWITVLHSEIVQYCVTLIQITSSSILSAVTSGVLPGRS